MPGRGFGKAFDATAVQAPMAVSFQQLLMEFTDSLTQAHEREIDELRTELRRAKAALDAQRPPPSFGPSPSGSPRLQDKEWAVDPTTEEEGGSTVPAMPEPPAYYRPAGTFLAVQPSNGDTSREGSESSTEMLERAYHVPDADVLDRIFKVAEQVGGSKVDPEAEKRVSLISVYDDPEDADAKPTEEPGALGSMVRVPSFRSIAAAHRARKQSQEARLSINSRSDSAASDSLAIWEGDVEQAVNNMIPEESGMRLVEDHGIDGNFVGRTSMDIGFDSAAGLRNNGLKRSPNKTDKADREDFGIESSPDRRIDDGISDNISNFSQKNIAPSSEESPAPARLDTHDWSRSDSSYSRLDEDAGDWQKDRLKVKVNPLWLQLAQEDEIAEKEEAEGRLKSASFELGGTVTGTQNFATLSRGKMLTRQNKLEDADKEWKCCCKLSTFIQSPSSRSRLMWDVAGMVFLGYDIVMVPLQVFNPEEDAFTMSMNITTGVFWSLDLLASFTVGYHDKGFIEMRPNMVAWHYFKSWFALDFVLVFLDWFFFVLGFNSQARVFRVGKLWRGMRVVRLVRLVKFQMLFNNLTERVQSEYKRTVLGIAKLVMLIVIVNHFLACGWFGISHLKYGEKTWVDKFIEDGDSLWYKYTTSLHWSLTQFTPASMEVVPQNGLERTYSVLVLLFALVTFSSFVSSITQAMTHLRNINSRRLEQDAVLRRYLSEHSISNPLVNRVLHFIQERQVQSCRLVRTKERDVELFKALPESVKNELRYEAFSPTLMRHPLFYHFHIVEEDTMRRICTKAVKEHSLLIRQELYGHTEVTDMVFVDSGTLSFQYSLGFRQMTERIEKGQWACEAVLWVGSSELCNPFVAQTNCELLLLNAVEFLMLIRRYRPCVKELTAYALFFVEYIQSVCNDRRGSGCRWLSMLCNDTECIRDLVQRSFNAGQLVIQQTSIDHRGSIRHSMRGSRVLSKGVELGRSGVGGMFSGWRGSQTT